MIKKTTTVIFQDGKNKKTEELVGGIPLSKGEIIHMHQISSDEVIDYEVADKTMIVLLKEKTK